MGKPSRVDVGLALLRRLPPHQVMLVLMMVGFAFIGASVLLGIGTLHRTPGHKEVGYMMALNWSLNYAVIFPVATFFMLSAIRDVPKVAERLVTRRMVWKIADGKRVQVQDSKDFVDVATALSRGMRRMVWFSILVAAVLSYPEFLVFNAWPLIGRADVSTIQAADWGHGALLLGRTGTWFIWLNIAFDFAAFTLQAVSLLTYFVFFWVMIDLAGFLAWGVTRAGFFLKLDLRQSDRRCGFEEFESLMQRMLYAALAGFLMAYASRLQKVYLRSSAQSLDEFVWNDVVLGMITPLAGLVKALGIQVQPEAFGPRGPENVFGLLVIWAVFAIFVLAFVAVILTLRSAAQTAKTNTEASTPEERGKLAEMEAWPLPYRELNVWLLVLATGILALMKYRIGLFIAGFAAFGVLRRLRHVLRSGDARG